MNATTQTIVQGNLPRKSTPPRGREPLAESDVQPFTLKTVRPLIEAASKARIASLGKHVLPAVLEAAKSPDALLRLNAIESLGAIGSKCLEVRHIVRIALNKALSDENETCRGAAHDELKALGRDEGELARLSILRIKARLSEASQARKQAEAQAPPEAA